MEQKFFEDRANEELGHAKNISLRLMQLGTNAKDDPASWEQDSGLGKLQPSRYLTLRSALEKHWNSKGVLSSCTLILPIMLRIKTTARTI